MHKISKNDAILLKNRMFLEILCIVMAFRKGLCHYAETS